MAGRREVPCRDPIQPMVLRNSWMSYLSDFPRKYTYMRNVISRILIEKPLSFPKSYRLEGSEITRFRLAKGEFWTSTPLIVHCNSSLCAFLVWFARGRWHRRKEGKCHHVIQYNPQQCWSVPNWPQNLQWIRMNPIGTSTLFSIVEAINHHFKSIAKEAVITRIRVDLVLVDEVENILCVPLLRRCSVVPTTLPKTTTKTGVQSILQEHTDVTASAIIVWKRSSCGQWLQTTRRHNQGTIPLLNSDDIHLRPSSSKRPMILILAHGRATTTTRSPSGTLQFWTSPFKRRFLFLPMTLWFMT